MRPGLWRPCARRRHKIRFRTFPGRNHTDPPIEHGIYEWAGEMLRICTTGFRNPWPDGFETKAGDNRRVLLLKRLPAPTK